jgi:ferredoxin
MFAGLLFDRIARQAHPAVGFYPHRCLRSRLSSNECELCLALCAPKAITLDDGKIVFRQELCTGCMACVSGCPNDALGCDFDFAALLQALRATTGEEQVVLSCAAKLPHAGQITLPCLGLLTEPILAALNSIAPAGFFLDTLQCQACRNGHILELLHAGVRGLEEKTGRAGLKLHYLTGENYRPAPAGQPRRSFLRLAGSSIFAFGRDAAAGFTSPGRQEKPDQKPDQKLTKEATMLPHLLHRAFALLPEEDGPEKELLLAYFYTLKTNADCNLCPSCTGMCPTGALKRRSNAEDLKQLTFISARCSGCNLCVLFCRKKALTLDRGGVNINPGAPLAIA